MAHIQDRGEGVELRWQARYRCKGCSRHPNGGEHSRSFKRKRGRMPSAQAWLDEEIAKLTRQEWVDPSERRVTVQEWAETWLAGYHKRPGTVKQARVHLKLIVEEFGPLPLGMVRPSQIRSWLARLGDEGYAPSYLKVLHGRLRQLLADAVHDGLLKANPCSKRTAPSGGRQRVYVATTEQVWSLYDAFPERRRLAVLLGAFAGLTTAEACGLRVEDVAFLEREIRPTVQYPAEPLKTDMRYTPVPVADSLLAAISAQVARWPSPWLLSGDAGEQVRPRLIQADITRARKVIEGLPDGFRFHDLRHYYASLLIASGADVKIVQNRLRHTNATTTLNVYAHLWPDSDESTRTAVERVLSDRLAESLRNGAASSG